LTGQDPVQGERSGRCDWPAGLLLQMSKMARIARFLGLTFFLLAVTSVAGHTYAEGPNQAGLVVQFGDGRIEARCVAFEGNEISGADLLTRSGLKLIVDTSSGMGITVCQIEGEGCAFPAEPCFCQCTGGDGCAYWNYFYREPGATGWDYSALGAILRKVKPGSVEGWVWGNGHTPPDDQLTFETICLPPTATPSGTPAPATPSPATATFAPTMTQMPASPPTALPTATSLPPSPTPTPIAEPEPSLADYWPFGVMIMGLAAVAVVVWLRRS
jgi:hypothetical protein